MNNRALRIIVLFASIVLFADNLCAQLYSNEPESSTVYVFEILDADEPAEIKEIVQTLRESSLVRQCKFFSAEGFFKIQTIRPIELSEFKEILGSSYTLRTDVKTSKGQLLNKAKE